MTCALPLDRQRHLVARIRRALRAVCAERISQDCFDAILARVDAIIGAAK
jgi:histone H3/H4